MPMYLVEFYASRSRPHEAALIAARMRAAAETLRREGRRLRLEHALVEPAHELCLCFLDAEDAGLVREAARRADLPLDAPPEELEVIPVGPVPEKEETRT